MRLDKLQLAYLDIKDREIEKLLAAQKKALAQQVDLQKSGEPPSPSLGRHLQRLAGKISELQNDRDLLEARFAAGLSPGLTLGKLHSTIPRPTLNKLAYLRKSLPATKTTEG